MANLGRSVRRCWSSIPKSNVAGAKRTTHAHSAGFKRYSLGSVVAVSGAAVIWWFTSHNIALAEAPHHAHTKTHGRDHTHVHGHDKRLVPHAAPSTPTRPVAHENKAHVTDVYEKLEQKSLDLAQLPVEEAVLTSAPKVPPSITRDYPVILKVDLTTTTRKAQLTGAYKYEQWTFNDQVPGPFIRARVGDVVEVTLTNKDESGMHITSTATLFWGLGPADRDLPPVDKEYYVMQSEWYHEPPEVDDHGKKSSQVEFSYPNSLCEEPDIVVFNGSESAMTREKPLKANVNDTVRILGAPIGLGGNRP
ncbi:uncharacterized protein Z518_11247 [Rhinocladiella mackenziei CBS 650.93]|uniref:Plastocyanin-like domain-containing protein n=1 Tax=Rhinocladiella mackenziei CBS 650.93 TaxID=1442369 RepID=A0A0D2I1E1_9EURO|nr:uncharacterized protein Z518_11247 [Rhinocladiella mackenziei CBS 650.93]KIW99508.1 hypothetical protein Z518_11247 [Rhinocladiella mackenziei CBS 650.93]